MTSAGSKFRILPRGFKDTMVLIPGWAADHRVFELLDLDYNYIVPVECSPPGFADALSEFLAAESPGRVSILGWSQGGFLAADFAARNAGKIDKLVLVGIRKGYDKDALEGIKRTLTRNKTAFLYRFYLNCFSPSDSEGRGWFKSHLLREYLDQMSLEYLLGGLEYLSRARMETGLLSGIRAIRVFHGGQDAVAPLEEALAATGSLAQARFTVLDGLGHLPFLNPGFRKAFYD